MNPTTFARESREWKTLEIAAKYFELESKNNASYRVENVYFDYGQNWMWTTIVRRGYEECQILNPRDWEEILSASNKCLYFAVRKVMEAPYFGDR